MPSALKPEWVDWSADARAATEGSVEVSVRNLPK
jgi:hypothetical protein